ncbi:hypothetical protein J2X65_002327 [Ancylobacter sp. 3268]|uniref:hypothetical protein n=1 Tax=Ancylobacter sp. 3268 TaxID=2817752 RepID=UPI002865AA5D|nr:hypothetical protein [Ancylobacter sp. 3268]MDR6952968.1 hypothetical protein [Ancylobacter sp. 3268]
MRNLAEPRPQVSTPPQPLPALASQREPRQSWVDLLALHLDARRNWRELAETAGSAGDADLNEVDVFLVGIIARFAGAARVLVDSAELARRLEHCRADPAFSFVAAPGELPAPGDMLLYPLAAIERAGRAAAGVAGPVVLVHGGGRDWQGGAAVHVEGVRHRPLAGLSPALWKSSLLMLASETACGERERLLAQVTTLLADRALDPFFLLDQIQELRAAARRPEAAPDEAEALKARIAELEHEVASLRRYAVIQQESLTRLGGAADRP